MTEEVIEQKENQTLSKAKRVKHLYEIVEGKITEEHTETIMHLASEELERMFKNQADPADIVLVYDGMKKLQQILHQMVGASQRVQPVNNVHQASAAPINQDQREVPNFIF